MELAALLFAVIAQAGIIGKDLKDVLGTVGPDEPLAVMIRPKDKADLSLLTDVNLSVLRTRVITTLKQKAANTQSELKSAFPQATVQQLEGLLRTTAVDLGGVGHGHTYSPLPMIWGVQADCGMLVSEPEFRPNPTLASSGSLHAPRGPRPYPWASSHWSGICERTWSTKGRCARCTLIGRSAASRLRALRLPTSIAKSAKARCAARGCHHPR